MAGWVDVLYDDTFLFFVAELNYGFFFLFFRVPFYLWFLFIVFVVDDHFTFRCG